MRGTVILALGGLLVLLAAPTARAEDWKEVVRDFSSKDWKVRGPAYRALVKQRDPEALPHLRRALPDLDAPGSTTGSSSSTSSRRIKSRAHGGSCSTPRPPGSDSPRPRASSARATTGAWTSPRRPFATRP